MTTNNHPAHGPVSLDRLHQISEILSKAAAQSDGGNLGYAMADAVKVIDEVLAARNAEPVVPDDGREQFEIWMLKKWGRERQEYDFAMGKFLHGENYADSYTRHMWKAWSASRAAMLQAGNSPVTPDGWVIVPKEMTPEMMRAVQIKSELGGYAASELSGAYDMFAEFWDVAVSAAPQQEVK
ncbi:hypothetical protein HB89_002129 [Salmonella enterica subsp. enterica]|nr:hypothetical protein [Salmonella enterica subsp. enterica]